MNIKFSGSDAQGFHFNFGGTGNAGEPFGGQQPQRPKTPRKPVASKGKRTAINFLVTLLVGAGYFYINLPALNPQAEEFYGFVFLLCAVYCVCAMITSGFQGEGTKGYFQFVKKQCTVPFIVVVLMAVAIIVGTVSSWEVLRAGSYQKLLTVEQGDLLPKSPKPATTASPCWIKTAPKNSVTENSVSLPIWSLSLKWRRTIPRSTIMAAPCA